MSLNLLIKLFSLLLPLSLAIYTIIEDGEYGRSAMIVMQMYMLYWEITLVMPRFQEFRFSTRKGVPWSSLLPNPQTTSCLPGNIYGARSFNSNS